MDKKEDKRKIVIIGGGIAGLSAAQEIRKNSDEAEITIISNENSLPYYRLNLTRYLAKDIKKDNLLIHPSSWYQDKKIDFIGGKEVSEINKDLKQIKLDDSTAINYDSLIIATGAQPFIPPIVGRCLENVVSIRKIEDVDYVLEKISHIDSCICIGGGILGLETAGAIAKSGVRVTLIEVEKWLMPRQLNRNASEILKKYLKEIGIDVKENVKVKEIFGENLCQGIELEDGSTLKSKLVVITTGVKPTTDLPKEAGLEVGRGLIVNDNMQTSDGNIFAAGDVTEHSGILYGLWNVAQTQGKVAGANAIGINSQFTGIPASTILKVLGIDVFSIGALDPDIEGCSYYEKENQGRYLSFILKEDKIIGSIVIGDSSLSMKIKRAVEKGMVLPQDAINIKGQVNIVDNIIANI